MSASLGFASGLRLGLPAGLGLTRGRLWVGHGHGQGIGRGVGSRLLMGRPGALYRLPGDFEVVDDLRPRPDRGALTRLRGVLDQLVQAWIAPAMTGRLDCQSSPPGSRGPTVCKRRPGPPIAQRIPAAPESCPSARPNLTQSAILASAFLAITLWARIRFPIRVTCSR
jgi:hypothetical protein